MSTKIYTGFRLPDMRLSELIDFAREFGNRIQPLAEAQIVQFAAKRSAELIDAAAMKPEKPEEQEGFPVLEQAPLLTVLEEIFRRQMKVKREQCRDSDVDMSFSLTFFPGEGKLLGMVFTERQDFLDLWFEQPAVDHYPYWNNTDRPEGVSEEEWVTRGLEWDRALGKSSIPAKEGLTVTLIDEALGFVPTVDRVIEVFPSLEQRAMRVAREHLLNEKLREEGGKIKMSRVAHWLTWFAEEGLDSVKARAAEIAPKLVHPVTRDTLLEEPSLPFTEESEPGEDTEGATPGA